MNFREWNDAIAKELFNETKEGERVFLFCNSNFIDEIANNNNSSRSNVVVAPTNNTNVSNKTTTNALISSGPSVDLQDQMLAMGT